ncbi:hypothetical protein [Mycolicibacterium sp.]|uniref:hypothetical protein n=1 Tax=Mycolicibacterium sp. TaxID=2320850 RepID=UPI0037CAFDA0
MASQLFAGGAVPRGYEPVSVALVYNAAEAIEEVDLLVPSGSNAEEIRAIAEPLVADHYVPGYDEIRVLPYQGAQFWSL